MMMAAVGCSRNCREAHTEQEKGINNLVQLDWRTYTVFEKLKYMFGVIFLGFAVRV